MKNQQYIFLISLTLLSMFQQVSAATPKIVVTIKPLHSLVASITKGVVEPTLLLNTTQSPHHTNLRPSDYRKIANADIVFWATASMESFIPALQKKYEANTKFVSLMQADGIHQLTSRHTHKPSHQHDDHHNESRPDHEKHIETKRTRLDPHFWLSIQNARAIINSVTTQLIALDSSNTEKYLNNKKTTILKVEQLQQYLKALFNRPLPAFITYHDAYQYFENDFHLNRLASVSLNEEAPPGIKQIRMIKNLINEHPIQCIFYDAPIRPPVINTLLRGSSARAIELDVLGIKRRADESLWFDTMKTLGNSISQCLANN